jgi:hypothetical protein
MIRNSSRNIPDNVQFPFLAVRKLHAFWFWVKKHNRTGEDLLSASFNDAVVTEYTHKLRNDEHEMDVAKSQDPSNQRLWKLQMIGWNGLRKSRITLDRLKVQLEFP